MASFEDLNDQQRANLGRAMNQLLSNPEVSRAAKELLMKADPQTYRFPEVESVVQTNAALQARDKKIDELTNTVMQNEAQRRLEQRHAEARERGLDPEAVEKLITERGIANWSTAMEFLELQQRAAAPTPDSYELPTPALPTGKEWLKDPLGTARKRAHESIDELTARRRAAAK